LLQPTESEDSNDAYTSDYSQEILAPTPFGTNLQLIDHDDDDDNTSCARLE